MIIKYYYIFIFFAFLTALSYFCISSDPSVLWSIPDHFLVAGPLLVLSIGMLLLAPYPIKKEKLKQISLIHLTDKDNKARIMSGNIATLNCSSGLHQNIGNILIGKCLFMFNGHPNRVVKKINLFKKYNSENEAFITVRGEDITSTCYGRLLDNSILIPARYNGPATWTERTELQNGRDNADSI